MSSTRGRKRNEALPPSRARDIQRAFRARRAAHLQALEQRVEELEEENKTLRAALNLPPANRLPLGKGPTGKDKPKTSSSLSASPPIPSTSRSQQEQPPLPPLPQPTGSSIDSAAPPMHPHQLAPPPMTMSNARSMPQPMVPSHEHSHPGYATHPSYHAPPRANIP